MRFLLAKIHEGTSNVSKVINTECTLIFISYNVYIIFCENGRLIVYIIEIF